jgi:uncharacterized protein
MSDWQDDVLDGLDDASHEQIQSLLAESRRIAVLGIKPESRANKAAFYVPAYMKGAGYEIVPVPVYYPDCTIILGQPVYRKVADIPGDVDIVLVFRRSDHVAEHVDDILAKHPRAVWLQSGIRNARAARRLAEAGIQVVQDRCIMVEHRQRKRQRE